MNEDELVEITPGNFRLRKKYLKENERKRANYQESEETPTGE
jgi:GTP-binding protein